MPLDFQEIQKPGRKLRKLLKKMPAQPSQKQVHDLRTNSRRLKATLQAFGLDSTRKGRRVLKPLARLRKRAGKVRDMDVLTGYAANLRRPDGEQECAVHLLEHLGAERRKYAKKLHSAAAEDESVLRKRLKRSRKKFEKMESRAQRPGRDNNSAPVSALAISADLTTPARLNHTNLHPFRLKVKELRNVLKLADSPDEKLIDRLGQVKDAIGEWHDWEELTAFAEKVLNHGSQCKLVRELREMTRNKYRAALVQAERLRQQFGATSKHAASKQTPSPSKPVWAAAMKLAA